jgi:hypothetical protein
VGSAQVPWSGSTRGLRPTVSRPIDGPWLLGPTCLALLAVCLCACGTTTGGTVNNPPYTKDMTYDAALAKLQRWCPKNLVIWVQPTGRLPFGADGSQLFVERQGYTPPSALGTPVSSPSPGRSAPTTPVVKSQVYAPPAALGTPASLPSPGRSTPTTTAPPSPGLSTCDTSAVNTVYLTLYTFVPDVKQLSKRVATDRLRQHGLELRVGHGPNSDAAIVQTQDPSSGSHVIVDGKTPVSVDTIATSASPTPTATPSPTVAPTPSPTVVTTQPPRRSVTVPPVVGMTEEQACTMITNAKLKCATPPPRGGTPGRVVDQSPAAGTLVDDGTLVALQVRSEQPVRSEQQASGVPPWLIPTALALLVAAGAVVQRYRSRHPRRPPQVEVRLRPGPPQVRGDEAREW